MFIDHQKQKNKDYYVEMLATIGSLSRLFNETDEPYLHYRIAENLFCKSFGAKNLSRSDTSADASLDTVGFGLKTFLQGNGKKMEKVAEFNSDSVTFRKLPIEQQVSEIIRLRNERIETTKSIYALSEILYHCVTRSEKRMSIIEVPMHSIDFDSHKITNVTDKSVSFCDKHDEYSFNFSKSTLFKRFTVTNPLIEIPVTIINDPFEVLEKFFVVAESQTGLNELMTEKSDARPFVYLPLFSTRGSRDKKEVPEKSGLNQWNAGGRPRKLGEVYIPIPAWIHSKFPDFFPEREVEFKLILPNKQILNASVCQENGKALMSNPNDALAEWMLRTVLKLNEGELLTYKKLEDIGLDSMVVYKNSDGSFEIDFAKVGEYDSFEESNK